MTSWFIGISAILLVLYLTVPKPNIDKEWFDYYFEAIAVLAYSMVAFGAPILWLGLRRIAQMRF